MTVFKNITSWKQSDLSILRAALCVQTLRITYEQLRHCSVVSACDQLLNIIEQNQAILGGQHVEQYTLFLQYL